MSVAGGNPQASLLRRHTQDWLRPTKAGQCSIEDFEDPGAGASLCEQVGLALQVVVRNGVALEALVPDYSELDYRPTARHPPSKSVPNHLQVGPQAGSSAMAVSRRKDTSVILQAVQVSSSSS